MLLKLNISLFYFLSDLYKSLGILILILRGVYNINSNSKYLDYLILFNYISFLYYS